MKTLLQHAWDKMVRDDERLEKIIEEEFAQRKRSIGDQWTHEDAIPEDRASDFVRAVISRFNQL